MRYICPLIVTALCAGLMTATAIAAAGPLQWQHALDDPSSETLDLWTVEALPGGGFRLLGRSPEQFDGARDGVFWDFDADAALLQGPMVGPPPGLETRTGDTRVILPRLPDSETLARVAAPVLPCRRELLEPGLERRLIDREFRWLGTDSGWLDAEDGTFASTEARLEDLTWIRRIYRLQADCSVELIGDVPFQFDTLLNSPNEVLAYAVAGDTALALDRQGLRWSLALHSEEGAAEAAAGLAVIDGDLLVSARSQDKGVLYRLRSDGTEVWRRMLPWPALLKRAEPISTGLALDGEALAVIDPDTGALLLTHRSADKVHQWLSSTHRDGLAGRFILSQALQPSQLKAIAADGSTELLRTLPEGVRAMLELTDDSVLGLRQVFDPEFPLSGITRPELLRLHPHEADADIELSTRLPWPIRPLTALATDDATLLLVQKQGRLAISRIDATGRLHWQQSLPDFGPGVDPMRTALRLRAAKGLACLIKTRAGSVQPPPPGMLPDENSLSCLDDDSGAPILLRSDFSLPDTIHQPQLLLGGDDGLPELVVRDLQDCVRGQRCLATIRRIEFSSDGVRSRHDLATETPTTQFHALAELEDGELLLSRSAGREHLLLAVGRDGSSRELSTLSATADQCDLQPRAYTLDDGSVLLVLSSPTPGASTALRLDASGQPRWSVTLPEWFRPDFRRVARSGDLTLLVLEAGDELRLQQIDADGSSGWSQAIGLVGTDIVFGLGDGEDGSVLVATRRGGRLLLRRFAADDGNETGAEVIEGEFPLEFAFWSRSGAATVLRRGTRFPGVAAGADSLLNIGIRGYTGCEGHLPEGFWFDPGSNGQGLVLHAKDMGTRLSGLWPSFTLGGGISRTELRWLGLDGVVEGDGRIAVQLHSRESRRFADSPAPRAQVVGSGELQLLRCNLMSFDYAFDEGEFAGATQRLHLLPLTPPGGDLFAPDFWFDPAHPDQGLLLQGIGETGSAPPRLIGAWASFDPEGHADDPAAQHWFTVQGERVDAERYQLAIFRTIGGALGTTATRNTSEVGHLLIEVQNCDRVRLTYVFDDSGAAAEFASLTGSLLLQRSTPCTGAAAF